MKQISLILLTLFLAFANPSELLAQRNKRNNSRQSPFPKSTPAETRLAEAEKRAQLIAESKFSGIKFENIGPTVMSGRVTDIAVDPQDHTHFYVAYASGGLWFTENNGTTFEPLFDDQAVMTIGDIAVDWKSETIYIGTGENNSSRSSYSGLGIYKSTDAGKTWQHLGLSETHHIGRIEIDPNNAEVIWVAALGHLYSKNNERGVYRTEDGGKTWTKTLETGDSAGAIDLVVNQENPSILFAATWERSRSAWDFQEGGFGSAIWHSTDGGKTWGKITQPGQGFPQSAGTGRIGLALYARNGVQKLYAMLDNQDRRDPKPDEKIVLKPKDFKSMNTAQFLEIDSANFAAFTKENDLPEEYDLARLKTEITAGKLTPQDIYKYFVDANQQLFDTPVKGAEIYTWDEKSKKWNRTHEEYLDDVVFSYGYYFGLIRVSPTNPDHLYIAGVPIIKSKDGGKTWESISEDNVHADHHALWVSPTRDGHLINGNDGGINISYDDGKNYIKCNSPAVGQFYTVNVDNAEPYNVYGGLQDNGVWKGPNSYEASARWQQNGHYPYRSIMGGDGMQIAIDTRDNETVYTGYQFGHYTRMSGGNDRKYIHPKHDLGEQPLRWNWQTPIHLSVHNQDILYMASNKFHRSMDQGENWETLSNDLTQGGKKGDVPFGTCTTISESPLRFGLLYVGTDDGMAHRSEDGGNTWKRINNGMPAQNLWVSRIQASAHEKNRVYMALNGYRFDHMDAYILVSENQGNTWTRLGLNLPKEPVNVFKEDPHNPDILYLGTDHGLYVSVDRGQTFAAMMGNLPHVPVHDLVVQARDKDLIIGTHGRSIYKADITNLETWGEFEEDLALFGLEEITVNDGWGNSWSRWFEPNEPEVQIQFYSNVAGAATISILTNDGEIVKTIAIEAVAGFNTIETDLSISENAANTIYSERQAAVEDDTVLPEPEAADNDKFYLQEGEYLIELSRDDLIVEGNLVLVKQE